jgi:hypothetical protein
VPSPAISPAHNLERTVGLNRWLRAPDFTTDCQAIEREAVELVLQRKTTAGLREDLDVASSSASLGDCCHFRGEGTAEGL